MNLTRDAAGILTLGNMWNKSATSGFLFFHSIYASVSSLSFSMASASVSGEPYTNYIMPKTDITHKNVIKCTVSSELHHNLQFVFPKNISKPKQENIIFVPCTKSTLFNLYMLPSEVYCIQSWIISLEGVDVTSKYLVRALRKVLGGTSHSIWM